MALTAGSAAPPSPLYPMQPGLPRLRVCIVLACSRLPAWLDETLAAMLDADFLDVHVIRTPNAPSRRQGGLAWRTYHALDRRLLGELSPVMALRDLPERLADAPMIPAADALGAAVARSTPDVVLSVGHSPARIDLWPLARRAAWSIPAEACRPSWGLMHLLPAFLRGDTSAPSGFPVHDDRAGQGLLLDPAMVSIAQLSFSRNAAYQLQKAPAKLLRALRRLQQGQPATDAPVDLARAPGTIATLALCARLVGRSLLRRLPRLGRRERWTLAARRSGTLLDPARPKAEGFVRWSPPRGWFWADPFPIRHEGVDHVFFEAYDYARSIGEIHAVTVDTDGCPSAPRVIMAGDHHLSYPFLFQHGGEPHLVVECAQSLRMEAHRASRFPDGWRPVATLLQGWRAVDGTLWQQDGRWWLFGCVAETPFDDGGREFNELFLFHAPGPMGPWTPHRQNPVVADVRRARPAGPLFLHGGRLIRPAQDCAAEYGHRIVFNEVRRLDPEVYEETPIGALEPDWSPALRGCHTYARAGQLELLDAKFLAPARDTNRESPS